MECVESPVDSPYEEFASDLTVRPLDHGAPRNRSVGKIDWTYIVLYLDLQPLSGVVLVDDLGSVQMRQERRGMPSHIREQVSEELILGC